MKKVISLILCFLCVVYLSSCDDGQIGLETEKIIAVKFGSANEIACEEYASDGLYKVTYESSSDVVLAVENGKADCGILDEFEVNSFIRAGRNIRQKESCEYSIDYCAYFDLENEELRELFNEAIKELNDNGTIDKIQKAHFQGESFFCENDTNENGTLTMLCDPNFEKRVYTDDSGEIVGLDVDIAREICNYLGFHLEIVTADFDELFIKLQEGEGDFIISACEVNEEREACYLSSNPYFTLNYYLIVRE